MDEQCLFCLVVEFSGCACVLNEERERILLGKMISFVLRILYMSCTFQSLKSMFLNEREILEPN